MFQYLALCLAALTCTAPIRAAPNRFRHTDNHVGSVVEVTETCVDKLQEIVIHFENSKRPMYDDWVGVYPTGYDAGDEPQHWVHTCGTGLCEEALREGTISIAGTLLPAGVYVAVLARDEFDENNDMYVVLGESEEFTVRHDACDDSEYR